jgi:RNA polymerase sigma-70 factor (ECF subfamily)
LERAEKVFAEHHSFIRTAIRFHVNNEAECDDLFQEFFLSLIINPIPTDVKNIRGFLYRAVTFRAKDAFRRKSSYQKKLSRYARNCTNPDVNCPESSMINAEALEKISRLIQERLPRHEATAISLKFNNENNGTETAKSMGVKTATVNRYVCTGIKKIRTFLKKEKVSS